MVGSSLLEYPECVKTASQREVQYDGVNIKRVMGAL